MFSQSDSFRFINCSSNKELSSVQERVQEEEDNKEKQRQQGNNATIIVPVTPLKKLKVEIPSSYEEVVMGSNKDEDEGLKTPTSSDYKVPEMLECPGAPRKTKSRPRNKRKTCSGRIVVNDSKELESLFPMSSVAGDLCPGGKKKKAKQFSGNEKKP